MPWLLRIMGCANSAHFDGTLVPGRSRPQHPVRTSNEPTSHSRKLAHAGESNFAIFQKMDEATITVRGHVETVSPWGSLRRSRASSAFDAGQVMLQVTPEGAYSSSARPLALRSTISFITTVPNPRRCGGDTGGPPRSLQLIVKVSSSVPQRMSTRPASFESAPYF